MQSDYIGLQNKINMYVYLEIDQSCNCAQQLT